MPGKRMVCDGINVFDISLALAANEIYDVLVVDIWVQNHIVPTNHIVIGILGKDLVSLSKVVFEMKAGFMDWNGERMVPLVKRHEVVPARELLFIKFVETREVLIELPAEPDEETGFHIMKS
jgi:hypothetical protein